MNGAVLLCDQLVARCFASAAAMAGSGEAPRDPAVVAMLLGVGGARYLGFRAIVRAARGSEEVALRDTLEAFVFAMEVRRARDQLSR